MTRVLWQIFGKGRCAGAVAHVIAESAEAAVARLTRDDACVYFDVDRVEPFAIELTAEISQPLFDALLRRKPTP